MIQRRLREILRSRPLAATLLLATASLSALASALAAPPPPLPYPGSGPGRLTVVERVLTARSGGLANRLLLEARRLEAPGRWSQADFNARVEGWLSNSRVAVHATPRRSECVIAGQSSPMAAFDVISAPEEVAQRCRERAVLASLGGQGVRLGPAQGGRPRAFENRHRRARRDASRSAPARAPALPLWRLRPPARPSRARASPGRRDHDPRQLLPLDREQYLAQPKETWPEPPEDHKRHPPLRDRPRQPAARGGRAGQPVLSASPSVRSAIRAG